MNNTGTHQFKLIDLQRTSRNNFSTKTHATASVTDKQVLDNYCILITIYTCRDSLLDVVHLLNSNSLLIQN